MMTTPTLLGVIGGSGVYQIEGLSMVKEHDIVTPFGKPSDHVIEGDIDGRKVFFLPRHGRGHRFTPTEVNYRANIHAMKQCGVTHLLAVSAVGIMRESIKPGDMIVPDQLFDRTRTGRASTFFGEGVVGHVSFADPFSNEMRSVIVQALKKHKARFHDGGTLVVMEGPQFSTRAESHFYRKTLDPVAIGMTALPEAKLAREAELCYGMMAMATDYDCWHESEEDVSVEAVMAVLKANSALASQVVKTIALDLPRTSTDPCLQSAKNAIMTHLELIPTATRQKLEGLYGKYFRREH